MNRNLYLEKEKENRLKKLVYEASCVPIREHSLLKMNF